MNAKRDWMVFRLLSLVLVLALSLGLARPAHAEGEIPPAEPAPGEGAPQEGDPGEPPAPADGETPAAPELGEVVDTLAENNLSLTGPDGEAIPLSSPQAAELLSADPWFVAGGVTYRFFPSPSGCDAYPGEQGTTCFDADTPPSGGFNPTGNAMQDVIEFINIKGILPSDRLIYVDGTGNNEQDLELDGSRANLGTLAGIVGTGSGSTVFTNTYFNIKNFAGGFLIRGMAFSSPNNAKPVLALDAIGGTIKIEDVKITNANTATAGIRISNARGAVELREVDVRNTGGDGIYISNTAGSGNVTLVNVNAAGNANNGAAIDSKGTVVFNGVITTSNGFSASGSGAVVTSQKGLNARNSVFDGNNVHGLYLTETSLGAVTLDTVFASSNQSSGIVLFTRGGAVKLTNVRASSNVNGYGIWIDSCNLGGGPLCGNLIASSVTLSGIETVSNKSSNIWVLANGAVSLSGINASSSSQGAGIQLSNQPARAVSTVTVSDATASGNHQNNVEINSRGAVTLNKVWANSSSNGSGIVIQNDAGTGAVNLLATLGQNQVQSNLLYGLQILSKGAVSVGWISANSNKSNGIEITTSGPVTINGKSPAERSTSDGNKGWGIKIRTSGAITLTSVDAVNNEGTGFNLENADKTGVVRITNSKAYGSQGDGYTIRTQGAVFLTNVSAENNQGYGVYINNVSARLQGVTVTTGSFNRNLFDGLRIESQGAVAVSKVSAAYNDYAQYDLMTNEMNYGEHRADFLHGSDYWYFENNGLETTTITIRGEQSFSVSLRAPDASYEFQYQYASYNSMTKRYEFTYSNTLSEIGDYCIMVSGSGRYQLKLENASNPASDTYFQRVNVHGVYIDNSYGGAAVTFSGNNAENSLNYNATAALFIRSKGNIRAQDMRGGFNGDVFAQLINSDVPGRSVTLSNLNTASNFGEGIRVQSSGAVTLSSVSSYNNGGTNLAVTTEGAVSITGIKGVTNYNSSASGSGVFIQTRGNITLANLISSNNFENGFILNNRTGGGSGAVSLTEIIFENNQNDGIAIQTNGAVVLRNLFGNQSGRTGIDIDNAATLLRPVTLTNVTVNNSKAEALRILSAGAVTITGLTAEYGQASVSGRDAYAVSIDNSAGSAAITLSNLNLSFNPVKQYVLWAYSAGPITLTNARLYSNSAGGGFSLDNSAAASPRPVVLRGVQVYYMSGGHGGSVQSKGDISAANITASNNSGGWGLVLNNTWGLGKITVNTSGSALNTFENNKSGGLSANTNGAVALSNAAFNRHNDSGALALKVNNTGGAGNVTLSNLTFESNYQQAQVRTKGAISADRITARQSSSTSGVDLMVEDNLVKAVSVSRSLFEYCGTFGLKVVTSGPVTLNNLSAFNNSTDGVWVDNSGGGSLQPVTLLGSFGQNTFSNNWNTGLRIKSGGRISVARIIANENTVRGITLETDNPLGVAVSGVVAKNNSGGSAVEIVSSGPVSVSGLQAFYNHSGLTVTTNNAGVTVKDSALSANNVYGIEAVLGSGVLTLNNTTYFGNSNQNIYKH